jgi:hypothetical protein
VSSAKTRIIRLGGDSSRDDARNERTMILTRRVEPSPRAFRELFVRNYVAIRRICTSHARAGLAVVAVDVFTGSFMGSLWLGAKDGSANSAIIGRHGRSDLWLTQDPSLSLRHLAVVLWPVAPDGEVRFRILDLRTPTAFLDERGERYESLVAEGPLFLRCGSHALFLLTTGDDVSWPDDADDGWACIPERVYLESEEAEPDRWRRKRTAMVHRADEEDGDDDQSDYQDSRRDITLVQRWRGPTQVGARLLAASERPLGIVCVSTNTMQQELVVGQQAVHDGVLLGRYERCDGTGLSALAEEGISRVHVLIVAVDDRLYAIDTASSNGTRRAGEDEPFHITELEPEQALVLANMTAKVRWFPA